MEEKVIKMTENINRGNEKIVSRETAGKIPWKYLTILLAVIIALGVLWLAATFFAVQTPAKTSTDFLMNSPDKLGGDKVSPAVNGTETPSPTVNKGQEIYDQWGNKAYVVSTISDIPIGTKEHYIKKGMFEIEMAVYEETLEYTILKLEIPPQDQRFGLRVKVYDKNGVVI